MNDPSLFIKVLIGIVLLWAAFTSVYTVKPDENAVVTRLGKYVSTQPSGLHFKLPFGIHRVQYVSKKVRQQAIGLFVRTDNRRMSSGRFSFPVTKSLGRRDPDNESLMLTGDLNMADVEWVVHFIVTNPRDYLFNVADPDKNIFDLSQATMRQVVGDLSINDVLRRTAVEEEAKDLLQGIVDEYKMGVSILAINLQNVDPPESVKPFFHELNAALQEQKQAINRAEGYYNQVIPEARGKAQEQISEAEGYATATINRAQGDADKFARILKEYEKAPDITRTRLYLDLVEEVLQRVGSFTVIDPDVKGVLPIFNGQNFNLTRAFRKNAENASSHNSNQKISSRTE